MPEGREWLVIGKIRVIGIMLARRRKHVKMYRHRIPQVRIQSMLLTKAGFREGDELAVVSPRPGVIVLQRLNRGGANRPIPEKSVHAQIGTAR